MRPLERAPPPIASFSAPNGGDLCEPRTGKRPAESTMMLRIPNYSLIPGTSEFRKYGITEFQNSKIPKSKKQNRK